MKRYRIFYSATATFGIICICLIVNHIQYNYQGAINSLTVANQKADSIISIVEQYRAN
jgi:hypothetical protein